MTMLETLPPLWLGQSVRTTMVVDLYPSLAELPFMASLGDAIHRPRLVDRVFRDKLRSRLRATGPLMLDSGGFTLMMRASAALDVGTLGDIYQTCGADLVVALDQPATRHDPPADRDRKHAITLENLTSLARVVDHARLVPVIHGPEIADIARNAAASAAIAPGARMVALGGLVPTLRYSANRSDDVLRHLTAAVDATKTAFPHSAIHILGAGAPRTLSYAFRAGASSVDSIGWRRAAGFGTIFLAGRGERFVEQRDRDRPRSRPLLGPGDHDALSDCACPPCSTTDDLSERIALLASHYMPRAAHNAWTLHTEAMRYHAAAMLPASRSPV
ncbi:MAG: hypothetical protein ACT6R2_04755 [Blastomonas fulva]|uniref:hypothetical protein n=1 Tax=Blastomonas fulva TaxID=1550728 RepID=UPI0040340413